MTFIDLAKFYALKPAKALAIARLAAAINLALWARLMGADK